MTGLLALIVTAGLSYVGADALGGILGRFGLFGFGQSSGLPSRVLKIGKALRQLFDDKPDDERRRDDLKAWLSEHDPSGSTGLGKGVQ